MKATRRESRRVAMLLAVSTMVLLGVVVVLYQGDIRLGQGSFAYRYSPLYGFRMIRALPTVLLAGAAGAVVWLLATRPHRRKLGLTLLGVVAALLVAWTWWAPPAPVLQHTFNFLSPSHDGAFVREAKRAPTARAYLRDFNQRIQAPGEEFKGTRVISNPPGMTILAKGTMNVLQPDVANPRAIDRYALSTPPNLLKRIEWPQAMRVAFASLLMWGASGFFA